MEVVTVLWDGYGGAWEGQVDAVGHGSKRVV